MSWQIKGENVEAVTNFIFLGSKIMQTVTAAKKLKDALPARKKSYDKPNVLKSIDITSPTKVHIFKAMVLPVVMYRCESWSIKTAEY